MMIDMYDDRARYVGNGSKRIYNEWVETGLLSLLSSLFLASSVAEHRL